MWGCKLMYESGNELILDCNSDVCSLICPKCYEKVEYEQTVKKGETVHCCSKENFCLRVKDVIN